METKTRKQIQQVIDKVPQLTAFGIGVFDQRKLSDKEYKEKMKKDRDELLNSTDEFIKVCKWLGNIKKIKSINKNISSYGLKHIAEQKLGYITNGVFIAAAIHCGFDYKIYWDDPNVHFNMSQRSINENDKYIQAEKARRMPLSQQILIDL